MSEAKDENSFRVGKYLSPSQIDIIKSKEENLLDPTDQKGLVALIDGFTESNGTQDEAYSRLYRLLLDSEAMLAVAPSYPLDVQQNLPIIPVLAYYDYLVLVGVLSPEDILKMQSECADLLSGKKNRLPQA